MPGLQSHVVTELPCRYDVLLTANATPGNYWISAQSQYRMGTPSGFAVLTYSGTNASLPSTTPSQPGSVKPWTLPQINAVCSPAPPFPPFSPPLVLLKPIAGLPFTLVNIVQMVASAF